VGVTKVEFYDGSTLMTTATTSPYSYSWAFTGANNGTHNWTAKAYDGAGNTAISSAVTVMVNIGGASSSWVRQIGGSGPDRPRAVTTANNGDVLVTGTFTNTVDFGGGPVSVVGGIDGFLARYSSNGDYIWSRRLGGTGNDTPVAMAVDTNDNILVTGVFQGTIDLGGGPLVASSSNGDIFIAKFSSTGSHLWSKRIGGTYGAGVDDIATDTNGGFFLTGSIYEGDLGDGTLRDGLFLARYSGQGACLWSRAFRGTVGVPRSVGVVVSGTNEVLLVARHYHSVDLGGGLLNPVTDGKTTLFIAKYSGSAGDHLWSERFGGTADVMSWDVAGHEDGGFTVVGAFSGTADLGGGSMTANQSGGDAFAATYSSDGAYRWAKHFGYLGSGSTCALGVAAAGAGSIAVTGFFQGYVDFGGATFFGTSYSNTFVARYSNNGAHLWSDWYGEPAYGVMDTLGKSVVVDSAGATIVAGQFNYSERSVNGQWVPSTIDFGAGPMTSNGAEDIFLLKLAP